MGSVDKLARSRGPQCFLYPQRTSGVLVCFSEVCYFPGNCDLSSAITDLAGVLTSSTYYVLGTALPLLISPAMLIYRQARKLPALMYTQQGSGLRAPTPSSPFIASVQEVVTTSVFRNSLYISPLEKGHSNIQFNPLAEQTECQRDSCFTSFLAVSK